MQYRVRMRAVLVDNREFTVEADDEAHAERIAHEVMRGIHHFNFADHQQEILEINTSSIEEA
jgi:hypothetical protein